MEHGLNSVAKLATGKTYGRREGDGERSMDPLFLLNENPR